MAGIKRAGARPVVAGLTALLLVSGGGTASAQTGGAAPPGSTSGGDTSTTPQATGKPGKAKLIRKTGMAIPPSGAPPEVVAAIEAGNAIRKRPYVWGGGHASFESWGYDCSGAVSYVLRAAGMLSSPLPSGPLMSWGLPGKGRWITVMANRSHTYAVVAGLRWDTSSYGSRSRGKGPRWRAQKRRPRGFAIRHAPGY
jgi:hypothetical protein